ncbi:Sucrase-isomaltase, intestinal [Talaromyces islandicus]|uniref:Sucrase-isomaltase, intestinal n=1 Tax=Talaromyces islandicus TaxID=28573 RepID=A0A0U1M1S0_TALIS|nr:Sucrase-isomaltase, intestinal [Talaromyces islandicus]
MDDKNGKLAFVTTKESSADVDNADDTAKTGKYLHPKLGEVPLTKDQCDRYEKLISSPREFVNCFSIQRKRMLVWLWPYIGTQRLYYEKQEPFERFLASAEKILALRKQQQKMKKQSVDLYRQIVDMAADYILNHQTNIYDVRLDVKYFIGQILWSFYEKYPECGSKSRDGKDPLEQALEGISSFSDSKLATVTTEIGVLLPNMRLSESDFSKWKDGKLYGLCSRLLKSLKSKDNQKGIEESGYTVNIRIGLASHTTSEEAGDLFNDALKLARNIHGRHHPITWRLTEQLGKFYLDKATYWTCRYYLSKVKGDKVKGVQSLYEDFLNGAMKEDTDNTELLTERVAPALAQFYKNHGQDEEARSLLWKFTQDKKHQIYAECFAPFVGVYDLSPLCGAIHRVEGSGFFSDFSYSSLETAVFKIDKVLPQPVEPSDEEKMEKWHPVLEKLPMSEKYRRRSIRWIPGLPGGYEAQVVREPEYGLMALELPYITYKYFKCSEAYRFGCTYALYCKGSINHPVLTNWKEEYEKLNGFCHFFYACWEYFTLPPNEPVDAFVLVSSGTGTIEGHWYDKGSGELLPSDEKSPSKRPEKPELLKALPIPHPETTQGFFNNTPGDIAVIDHDHTAKGFNLVSAEWIDWRRFVLHTSPSDRQPKLAASDGSPIPVLGYIYGTWADFNMRKRWTGLQVYVVQARFELPTVREKSDIGALSSSCHFILNPDDLCKFRESWVPLQDARATCTFLNPSLLRVMNLSHLEPRPIYCFGSTPDDEFEGVTIASCPETDSGLLTELTRRDQWDNEYAYLYWNKPIWKSRLELLNEQAKAEMPKRKEWDEQYVKGAKQWGSVWK